MNESKELHGTISIHYKHGDLEVNSTCIARDWNGLIQFFINFLRGCGYVIPSNEDRV